MEKEFMNLQMEINMKDIGLKVSFLFFFFFQKMSNENYFTK